MVVVVVGNGGDVGASWLVGMAGVLCAGDVGRAELCSGLCVGGGINDRSEGKLVGRIEHAGTRSAMLQSPRARAKRVLRCIDMRGST